MIRLTHEGDERLVAFWRSLLPLAQYPSYHDVTLVCQDGETRGNRLLLALAIPHGAAAQEDGGGADDHHPPRVQDPGGHRVSGGFLSKAAWGERQR